MATLHHIGTVTAIRAIRQQGFTDGSRMVRHPWTGKRWVERGVWFSDVPLPDEHQSIDYAQEIDVITLTVPWDRLEQYEVGYPGQDRRRWYLPAALANQYLTRNEEGCYGAVAKNNLH